MKRTGLITESDRNVQILTESKRKKLAMMWGEHLVKGGLTREKLAQKFGVSRRTASRVILMHKDVVEQGKKKAMEKLKIHKTSKGGSRAKKPESTSKKEAVVSSAKVIASNKFISITKNKKTYNVDSTHPNFKEALKAVKAGDVDKALNLINIKRSIEIYFHGNFKIENGIVYYKNIMLDNSLTMRVIDSIKKNKPYEHLLNFFEKCKKNPSKKAVERLFDFLQHNDIEISEDGDFIAWKRVDDNYRDIYSGKFDNSVGKTVKMKRSDVDDNDNNTCSNGLHVAAKHYLPNYASGYGRIIKVKVDPRHVVSIPVDYKNSKMRCCKYVVIADVTNEFNKE